MKKLFIPFTALLLVFAGVSSCKKIVSSIFGGTDVTIPPVNVTVPAILAVTANEQSFGSYTQQINLDSTVRANTAGVFGINAVSTIKIKQVTISISNADALNNLSNFENARVTLNSNSNPATADLFTVTFPDQNTATYTFTPSTSTELLPYLKGNSITYTVYGKNRRITSKPLQMQVSVILRAN